MVADCLDRAILETLAYSAVFEYPLRLDELHRYLPVYAERDALTIRLKSLMGPVGEKGGFYFLSGNDEFVHIRRQREARSRRLIPYALRYGRILGALPFVRMAALTGSLAVFNASQNADFDYMLVAASGRVWTARAFALLFNRLTRMRGHTLCPNLIVSENALAWSVRDAYSAHELCQMIPVSGMDTYRKLMQANDWVKDFLPNAFREISAQWRKIEQNEMSAVQKLLEPPLSGKSGDRLERWEMRRKIARLSKQDGFGEETVFNAEICQGNFDHHRRRTKKMLEERLEKVRTP
jgi:hypothetical protein